MMSQLGDTVDNENYDGRHLLVEIKFKFYYEWICWCRVGVVL